MVFSSLIFIYGLWPLSMLAYYLCRGVRAKNASLLIFSLIFYAWGEPKYVLLLMFMALSSWFCALRIDRAEAAGTRRAWLAVSCAVDILLIGFFKYSGLVCSIFGEIPEFVRHIALPIGISFYTFQLMTYVIDVYRDEAPVQESYWNVLLYAALFHQCVAGPIVRYKSIAEELFRERDPRGELSAGISRFALGLGKKTLLANPCGALADALLLTPEAASDAAAYAQNLQALTGLSALACWLGMAAFTLQIYLDFSAYSDMAIGMGKMLGLHYPENFNYPYISRSVTEFWRRWHISLSTFFRDYVYIPLGGNRCSTGRMLLNMLVVWALTGLWHGASWNFVLWGLYYFVFLVLEKLFLGRLLDRSRFFSHVYLLAVVVFGWALFHFTDVRLGAAVMRGMLGLNGNAAGDFLSLTALENNAFLLLLSALVCAGVPRRLWARLRERAGLSVGLDVVRVAVPIVLLLLATASLVGDSYNPFIYFQF